MSSEPFLKRAFRDSADPADYLSAYMTRISQMVLAVDAATLSRVVDLVERTIANDRTIFLMGNGGSSACAAHLVNDLGPNSLVRDAPGARVFSLTDNVTSLTALANDSGFNSVFALQLKTWLRPGDMVIAFSVSGNSPNILEGVAFARELGCAVVGFTGFDGGRLGALSDVHVNFPSTSDEYGPVEDMFSVVGHAISGLVAMRRGRWLHH